MNADTGACGSDYGAAAAARLELEVVRHALMSTSTYSP
jgi:hypothetical protein